MDCAIKATQPVAVIGTGKLATDNPWEKVKMGRARRTTFTLFTFPSKQLLSLVLSMMNNLEYLFARFGHTMRFLLRCT